MGKTERNVVKHFVIIAKSALSLELNQHSFVAPVFVQPYSSHECLLQFYFLVFVESVSKWPGGFCQTLGLLSDY